MIIDNIDFSEMYREHCQLARKHDKKPADWDKRAEQYASDTGDENNPYTAAFLSRVNLEHCDTLLDIGCGPGTIAIPLAHHLQKVYGLDFSCGMLCAMLDRVQSERLKNVDVIVKAWEDDWSDVPVCDIVTCSRATMVDDIAVALDKLTSKAKKHVYATFTVDKHFIAPEIAECAQKEAICFPNYLYAVNVLYQKGFLPCVSYITTAKTSLPENGFDAFLSSVQWSLGKLDDDAVERLRGYYAHHEEELRNAVPATRTWAFVDWDVKV